MRVFRALGALLLLATLLVGVPAALLVWGNPGHLLDVDWPRALLRPDDGRVLLSVLAAAGWLAWIALALTTIGELLGVVSRGRVHIRVPGTAWLRPAVAGLVTAALAPALAASAAPPEEPPPRAVTSQTVQPLKAPAEPEPTPAAPAGPTHVVRPGDELWSLAEHYLQSGTQWRQIVALNPGIDAATPLVPGTVLILPAAAEPTAEVVVQRGDTLWDLAEEHLGDPERWPELHQANRDQIEDPDEIDVGWRLEIPVSRPPAPESTDPEPTDPESAAPEPTVPESTVPEPPAPEPPVPTPPPPVGQPRDDPARESGPAPGSTEAGGVDSGAATDVSMELLGPIGGLLAAGVVLGVGTRRRAQLLNRAVGRRLVPVEQATARFWTALSKEAAPLPGPSDAPPPTGVVLGWIEDEHVVLALEETRCTLLSGTPEHVAGAVAAALTGLACAPWAESVDICVVASDDAWASAIDDPRITDLDTVEEGLAALQRLCSSRRMALGTSSLAALRAYDDLRSAWAPVVFAFATALTTAQVHRVLDCLSLGHTGVSVLAAAAPGPATDGAHAITLGDGVATMPGSPAFVPQLLSAPARRAVISLFSASTATHTVPAPWWRHEDPPPNVSVLPHQEAHPKDPDMTQRQAPDHPTVCLLGPVELRGARGERPNRATVQCIEYCTWLLEHPGATPSQMTGDLLIAEGTRRSNMCRLRAWLGADGAGAPYLPDAYSGRITLSPQVSTDWEQFQNLLSGGVNYASSPILREALALVRGEPLQDVAFQWPWADALRRDMISMITDAAAALADRATDKGDIDGALWAVQQGKLAAGDADEILTCREIHAHAVAGDKPRMERAVRQLTRAARATGRDLQPDTVRRIQHALHLSIAGSHHA